MCRPRSLPQEPLERAKDAEHTLHCVADVQMSQLAGQLVHDTLPVEVSLAENILVGHACTAHEVRAQNQEWAAATQLVGSTQAAAGMQLLGSSRGLTTCASTSSAKLCALHAETLQSTALPRHAIGDTGLQHYRKCR